MAVTLNTQNAVFDNMRSNTIRQTPSFKANEPEQPTPQTAQDEVVIQEPQKKKSIIRHFKDGMASIKKMFINVGEYTKSTAKGLLYGGVAAGGILGYDAIKGASKIIKAAKAGDVAGKAVKVLSTKGKVLAGVTGLAVLGYQLFKASLNVSQKNADVDHRWGSGHNG